MFYLYLFSLTLYTILAWKKYDWAFLVLVASLPLYLIRFDVLGIPFTLLEGMFFVVFGFWFVQKAKDIYYYSKTSSQPSSSQKKRFKEYFTKRKKYPFSFGIILFILSSFIGLAVAGFSNAALGIYKAYFIEAALFFILTFNYLMPSKKEELERRFKKLIISLGTGALIVSLIAVYQKINGAYWPGGAGELRVTGPFSYPNALALFLGPIIVLLFFYIASVILKCCSNDSSDPRLPHKQQSPFSRTIIFLIFTFAVSLLALLFSKSEAGMAAVVFSIFFGSLFINKKFFLALLGIFIIASTIVIATPNVKKNILWQAKLNSFSGEVRKQQWQETWVMLKNDLNFISGCGLSEYQACIAPYHQEGIFFNIDKDPDFRKKIVIWNDEYRAKHWRPVEIYMYPHNFFLNFWVELGLLGLIAVIVLLGQFFWIGIKMLTAPQSPSSETWEKRILIIGLLSAMLEIIIHGMVDVPYFKNDLSFLWWLLFAMMGVFNLKLK